MAIYQVINAEVWCDDCKEYIANIRIPKEVAKLLSRSEVQCSACGAKKRPLEGVAWQTSQKLKKEVVDTNNIPLIERLDAIEKKEESTASEQRPEGGKTDARP